MSSSAGKAGPRAGAGDLLALVRSGRATTRGALQQATGLSRATVGHRLDRLFRAGWLREGPAGPGGSPLGGRPSVRLEFDDRHGLVLAADLETRHARAAVLTLGGELLAEHTGPLDIAAGPGPVLDTLGRWFAALLVQAQSPADAVWGLVSPCPDRSSTPPAGSSSRRSCRAGTEPLPGLLGDAFRHHCGAPPPPVLVDNDANLMAYGEQRHAHRDCAAFALVKVSTGIGAGVVVDGGIFRGVDGGAGDIGHIRVPAGQDARCTCGAHGCLAAIASGRALAARLTEAGVPAASGSDVRDLLAAATPRRPGWPARHGDVGEVLATVVTLLNPGVLMIAGDLAGTAFLTGVRELLYERALPRSTAHLEVVTSRLGERAAVRGAGALVVEHVFAPERVEERLAALSL
ncbi:ROK family protein [Actinomadura keratinilytica]